MSALIDALTSILGVNAVLTGGDIGPQYKTDWTRAQPATPLAVVFPDSTARVAAVLKLCHAIGQSVVPQGGRTGLAGGAIPTANDLCLSLERMRGVEEIDEPAAAMTVLAGTTLETVQLAAAQSGFEFSLDMASRGSCQIGGIIAANAGGIRVMQSGTARDQVLGLEVVLADGTVLESLNKMLKNNTGYDLKHWFIGSEGTLGVITRAVLRLRAKPVRRHTALCALNGYDEALQLLKLLRTTFGNELSAFEMLWADFFDFGVSVSRTKVSPFKPTYPLYALVEQATFNGADQGVRFADVLSEALDKDIIADAVVSCSTAEIRALWEIRECTGDFSTRFNPVNFDISLPTGAIGRFAEECKLLFGSHWPGHRSYFFGHIGDSNLHVTIDLDSVPSGVHEMLDRVLYSLVGRYGGSISAEHGIGLLKREFLPYSRTAAELQTMRVLKKALDPKGILNPGKMLLES
jgi:FAD/FMN-containing dehydrogenase